MTISIVATSTTTASVDETNTLVTLPTWTWQQGDQLVMWETCQGDGGGLAVDWGVEGTMGWNMFTYQRSATGSQPRIRGFYKVSDRGTESGTQISVHHPNTTGACYNVAVIRGADDLTAPYCAAPTPTTGSVLNPTCPSLTAPWGSDANCWLIYSGAASLAAGAYSGTPNNGDAVAYSGVSHLSSNTTNSCCSAFAYTVRTAATETPTAWTRASGAAVSCTAVLRPAQPLRARVLHHKAYAPGTGNPEDITVYVQGGPRTRLVCAVACDALSSIDVLTVTLDPSGLNLPLAVASGLSTAEDRRFFSVSAASVPTGSYTLRIAGDTGAKGVWVLEIQDTTDTGVIAAIHETDNAGEDVYDTSINGEADGLILALITGIGTQVQQVKHTFAGAAPMGFGEVTEGVSGTDQCQLLVGRSAAGSNAIHLERAASSANPTLSITAISLGYAPAGNVNAPAMAA